MADAHVIYLQYLNPKTALVWRVEDFLYLRKHHRIIGNLGGCLPNYPFQDILKGMPLQLLPEETTLLLSLGVAKLVDYPALHSDPRPSWIQASKNIKESDFKNQHELWLIKKQQQLTEMYDKIILAKESKNRTGSIIPSSKDDFIKMELDKNPGLSKQQSFVTLHTFDTNLLKEDMKEIDWLYPSNDLETVCYTIFKYLWGQNYFITSGIKFGVHYLAYPGDPIRYHSHYTVLCITSNTKITMQDFIANGRLATNVKKICLLCTTENEKPLVLSIKWKDIS